MFDVVGKSWSTYLEINQPPWNAAASAFTLFEGTIMIGQTFIDDRHCFLKTASRCVTILGGDNWFLYMSV